MHTTPRNILLTVYRMYTHVNVKQLFLYVYVYMYIYMIAVYTVGPCAEKSLINSEKSPSFPEKSHATCVQRRV